MPETTEKPVKRTRRSEEDRKVALQAQISKIDERQKVRSRESLQKAKEYAEAYVSKYPSTKAATFANEAVAALVKALSQA
jgi:hypothetical protein